MLDQLLSKCTHSHLCHRGYNCASCIPYMQTEYRGMHIDILGCQAEHAQPAALVTNLAISISI